MDPASATRLALLDGFSLHLRGEAPRETDEDLPRAVQRLVAHLCLSGRPARTAIAGQLWPDVPEEHAQGSLRSALWRLHKAAPGIVQVSAGGVRLAADVLVDVRELSDWAVRAMDPGAGVDDVAIPAAGLHGDLLPGWYDDWVLLERERLRQLRMHALEAVAAKLLALERHGDALQAAAAAVRAEPLRESAHRTLVRVYLAEGDLSAAVRVYDGFAEMLADQLGVVPTEQMTRLLPVYACGRRAVVGGGRIRSRAARAGCPAS